MQSMETDQYLIQQLNNKFIDRPVMINRLIIANLYDHHPQDFFPEEWSASGKKECCVLTRRRLLYGLPCRPDRQARNGYWETSGYSNGKIFGTDGVIATKTHLCFYEGEMSNRHKTNWKMIEYRLHQHFCSTACDHRKGRLDNWVLCKVYEEFEFSVEDLSSEMEMMDIE